MNCSAAKECYDLLILVDATYSMYNYLESLQTSLPQIISVSALTDCFENIGLLAYRDYCDKSLLEWSGWLSHDDTNSKQPNIVEMAKHLEPFGGVDSSRATKTGLARAYELMRQDVTTIILLYTNAPPHTAVNGELGKEYSQIGSEIKALESASSYGGFGPRFVDWVSAVDTLSHNSDRKKAQVFSILEGYMEFNSAGYYIYLSTLTRGVCILLQDSTPVNISKVTVEILLAWMGAEKQRTGTENIQLSAELTRYISVQKIKKVKHESHRVSGVPKELELPDITLGCSY